MNKSRYPTMTNPSRQSGAYQALLATALALCCGCLHASNFEEDFDDGEKPWQEIVLQLPAPPKSENLIPFTTSATSTYTFFLDSKSLTVGSDAVVRYTVVAKSPGGAENISYEGIRCKLNEKKLYAFGHRDGTWSRSRRDKWEPITGNIPNPYQSALAKDYFCNGEAVSDDAANILIKMQTKSFAPNNLLGK